MALHDEKESTRLLLDYEDSGGREPSVFKYLNSRRHANIKSLSYLIFAFSAASFMVLYMAINWRSTKHETVSVPPVLNQILPIFTNESSSNNYTNQIFNDGCSVPIFDLYDESEKPFFIPHDDTIGCDPNLKPLTEYSNGSWRVTQEKEGRSCKARCYELPVLTGPFLISDWFPPGPTDCEFLEAVCWENDREVYGYIHTQILEKPPKVIKKGVPDVFVILVDSLSSRMMKRSLAKTVKFMTEQFQAVDFPSYSQVASRSQVNAVPLWFGRFGASVLYWNRFISGKQVEAGTMQGGREIEVDWSEDEYCHHYMDDKPNMFKDFTDAGYMTNYIDDWFYQTLWANPDCKGFQNYHSAHTFFPFVKIFEKTDLYITKEHLRGRISCRESYSAALEFFEQFTEIYKDRPKFVWYWSVHLAHNFLMGADRLDKPLLEFLQANSEMFDNAFVVLMADHGWRSGTTEFYATEIGNLEHHNPAFMMSVPKKYRDNGILEVLTKNSERLQTHYDLRATLLDIVKYQPSSQFSNTTLLKIPGEKGHSLLREQPLTPRNCETLPIIQEYCMCKSKSIDMKYDTKLSNRLATALITYVHDTLDEFNVTSQCHKYEFDKVTALSIISLNGAKATYKIVVKTKQPAIFETLVTDNETGKLEFGTIERVDRYGTTTYCTKKTHYTPLCYCKE
ncbi:hypothetical protein CRE_21482 [Caenorhabditis remanei]|uniref:Uncharacterized protein n=1 Tax=Caenorhabditis remanei TaxID=31234 RepID=E3N8Y0_CAERE|nr:hypothetical protein CRE_21482 [Caenorhabditis remanei]